MKFKENVAGRFCETTMTLAYVRGNRRAESAWDPIGAAEFTQGLYESLPGLLAGDEDISVESIRCRAGPPTACKTIDFKKQSYFKNTINGHARYFAGLSPKNSICINMKKKIGCTAINLGHSGHLKLSPI
jgi:hypothetical protein